MGSYKSQLNNRRAFIKKTAALAAAAATLKFSGSLSRGRSFPALFHLPQLPYKYSALEPHIDGKTMEIHYTKHHQAYVDNLNKALPSSDQVPALEQLMEKISTYAVAVRNNGGGHFNHSMFWQVMNPASGKSPDGRLAEAVTASFGTFEDFKKLFTNAALTRFGSGWAWLIKQNDQLVITSTANQDNPLMDIAEVKGTPLLCLDVWEHAYYLKYQNKRADYINAWWNVVDWNEVARRFQ